MRTKLLLATVCIFAIPFSSSIATGDKHANSAPYATVAFAGHVIGSFAYCECDTPQCECEPWETKYNNQTNSVHLSASGASAGAESAGDFDPGVSMMLITFVLLLGLRMRF